LANSGKYPTGIGKLHAIEPDAPYRLMPLRCGVHLAADSRSCWPHPIRRACSLQPLTHDTSLHYRQDRALHTRMARVTLLSGPLVQMISLQAYFFWYEVMLRIEVADSFRPVLQASSRNNCDKRHYWK
jgi:hypothetical protein